MPIYDNDGTASYQIGKVYDHDGTAAHQIGKVYDHDGTANYLIYSADPKILLDSTGNHAGFTFSEASKTGTGDNYFQLTNGKWVMRVSLHHVGYNMWDLFKAGIKNDGFSKLHVKGHVATTGTGGGGNDGIEVKIKNGNPVGGTSLFNECDIWVGTFVRKTGNVEFSYDISSFDTFSMAIRASACWDYGSCTFTIDSIYLD